MKQRNYPNKSIQQYALKFTLNIEDGKIKREHFICPNLPVLPAFNLYVMNSILGEKRQTKMLT